MANLQFEGLNVSLTEIKPPDYLNKDNVQKDEVTDKFYAQADALLKACQAKLKTGTTQILSTGPNGDAACRPDQSVMVNFPNGREIIVGQDHKFSMPRDARK